MTPSKIHYFFAQGFHVSTWIGAVVSAVLVGRYCEAFSLWSVVGVIVALPLGWILGGIFLWPFIFAIGSRINGSPFEEGDLVRVLVGPHRDQVGRIYEMWSPRNQVRVDIGEDAAKNVTDVFGYNEVWRERGG